MVESRLDQVRQVLFPILEQNGVSPSEALATILSFVTRSIGDTKQEDETDVHYFDALSLASAATLVAVTDHIVSTARESAHERELPALQQDADHPGEPAGSGEPTEA